MDYLEPHRICDGYPDCPLGKDEMNCYCPNRHNCGFLNADGTESRFANCIDKHLRCDNVQDCSNDEKNCYALSYDSIDGFPNQELEGWLQIQRSDEWYPLGFNILGNEQAHYKELFQSLAEEACQSTITQGRQAVW